MALSVLLAKGAQRSVTAQLRARSGPPRLSLRLSATHQRWSQGIRRRELLASGSRLWLFNQFQSQHSLAQQATAVFQEISVQVAPSSDGNPEPVENPPTYVKATGKIVAIGDLHGDMHKTVRCLQLGNVLRFDDDERPCWSGGDTVVVQLGDVLDRGDAEIAIINLLRTLGEQAKQQGGAVYMINGNHESLNVCGDFRYVTPGAFIESAEAFGIPRSAAVRNWEGCIQARAALYLPGGKIARQLSKNPTVLIVNDTAFAHGGLLPAHVNYGIERMNNEVAAWMRREQSPTDEDAYATPPFLAMGDGTSVMWNRSLSKEIFTNPIDRYHACNHVSQALARVGARRLVVGHTPQQRGVNCECDGKVWRVDVGMSAGVLDAAVGILEISANSEGETECKVVTERGRYEDGNSSMDEEVELPF